MIRFMLLKMLFCWCTIAKTSAFVLRAKRLDVPLRNCSGRPREPLLTRFPSRWMLRTHPCASSPRIGHRSSTRPRASQPNFIPNTSQKLVGFRFYVSCDSGRIVLCRSCCECDDWCVELTRRGIESGMRKEMGAEEMNEDVEGFDVVRIALR